MILLPNYIAMIPNIANEYVSYRATDALIEYQCNECMSILPSEKWKWICMDSPYHCHKRHLNWLLPIDYFVIENDVTR